MVRLWAIATVREEFRGGSLESVHTLGFARAPDMDAAQKGAEALARAKHPRSKNIVVMVAPVPRDSGSGPRGRRREPAPGEAPQSGLPQEGIAQPSSPHSPSEDS